MNTPLVFKTQKEKETIEKYNADIAEMEGYIYTGNKSRRSMDIFNNRASLAVENLVDLKNKNVIDIGCGDGTFSVEIFKRMGAAKVTGIEPSDAWKLAESKHRDYLGKVSIINGSIYNLPFPDDSFDFAVLRGVLHHLDAPQEGLREVLRVAKNIFILEPNGYNPVIKILEKVSPYHRAHNEKSFYPHLIRQWLEKSGGRIRNDSFSSLCPLLCPEWLSVLLDWLSPRWEKLPLIPRFTCGLYCVWASKNGLVPNP